MTSCDSEKSNSWPQCA